MYAVLYSKTLLCCFFLRFLLARIIACLVRPSIAAAASRSWLLAMVAKVAGQWLAGVRVVQRTFNQIDLLQKSVAEKILFIESLTFNRLYMRFNRFHLLPCFFCRSGDVCRRFLNCAAATGGAGEGGQD